MAHEINLKLHLHPVTIGELELHEGQKILYFFDYGDSWEFEVQLLKINKDVIPPRVPKVIEVKGEAPRQYGYYDDDDDEYMGQIHYRSSS